MVNVKIKGIDKLAKVFDPKKVDRASVNALNQTATDYRKTSVNDIASKYNLQKKRIRKDSTGKDTTFIERARRGKERAIVGYRGNRSGLQHFSPNKAMINKKKSPKVKIKRGGKAETIERGFFQDAKGSRGLFQREGKDRYPISRRTGPSTKQMYEDSEISGRLERKIPGIFRFKFTVAFRKQFKI